MNKLTVEDLKKWADSIEKATIEYRPLMCFKGVPHVLGSNPNCSICKIVVS